MSVHDSGEGDRERIDDSFGVQFSSLTPSNHNTSSCTQYIMSKRKKEKEKKKQLSKDASTE